MTRSIEERLNSLERNVADHEGAIYRTTDAVARALGRLDTLELVARANEADKSASKPDPRLETLVEIASVWMAAIPEADAWPEAAGLWFAWQTMMRQFRAAGIRPAV